MKCFMLAILPFTCRLGSSSWEAGSLLGLLHSGAMVKQAQSGKTVGAVCGSGDRSVSTVLGSHSEALPVEGLEAL